MGGAFIAVADDENAIHYNPAGLALISLNFIDISGRASHYFNSSRGVSGRGLRVSYARPNFGFYGFYEYYYVDSVAHAWDSYGNPIDAVYESNIFQFCISAGFYIWDNLAAGVNVKLSEQHASGNVMSAYDITSWVADAGILYKNNGFSAAITAENLFDFSSSTVFVENAYNDAIWVNQWAILINAGVAVENEFILAVFEIKNIFEPGLHDTFPDLSQSRRSFHLGAEITISNMLKIRTGLNSRGGIEGDYAISEFSAGAGIKAWGLEFDAALVAGCVFDDPMFVVPKVYLSSIYEFE